MKRERAQWLRWAVHSSRVPAVLAALGGLVGGILGTAAWLVSPAGVATPSVQESTITVPPGATRQLAAGESIPLVPTTASLTSGDRVVVTNQDTMTHAVAQYLIAPGKTAVIPFEQPGANRWLCTFHPGGALQFEVGERPSLVRSLLVVGAMAGLPLGALGDGITYLVSRLIE